MVSNHITCKGATWRDLKPLEVLGKQKFVARDIILGFKSYSKWAQDCTFFWLTHTRQCVDREYDYCQALMRQEVFAVGMVFHRLICHERFFNLALVGDANEEMLLRLSCRHQQTSQDLLRLIKRSQAISTTSFNINAHICKDCMQQFCFRPYEIYKNFSLTRWTAGKTKISRYRVDLLTEIYIMLLPLSSKPY